MAADVAQLTVKIGADATEANKKMGDTSGLLDRVKSGFEHGIGSALAWKAVDGVFSLVKDSVGGLVGNLGDLISAGITSNQIDAQLAAGLRSTHDASGMTADSLDNLAAKLSSQTGITDDAVKASESMLLTFTNIGQNVFPQATQAVADLATKMANGAVPSTQQMEQASIQLGKALGDPAKGYAQLQRVGVTFTKQQIEQIKTMEKSGNIAGAQAVILKEMNKEFGGSADAAGQANGGMAIFQATLENLKDTLGQAIIPILTMLMGAVQPLVSAFGQALPGALSTVQGWFSQIQPVIKAVGDGVQLLANVAKDAFAPAFKQIGDALSKVQGPGGGVKDIIGQINTVVQQAVPFIQQAAKAFGQLGTWFVSTGLPALQQFGNFVKTQVLPPLAQLGQFITTTVVPAIGQIAAFVVTKLLPAWAQMQAVAMNIILPALQQLAGFIITNVVPVIEKLALWFETKVAPVLNQVAAIIVNSVVPAVEQIWNSISANLIPAIQNLWNKLSPVLIPAFGFLGGILKNVVAPAISLIIGVLGLFINIIATVIGKIGDVLGVLGNLKDFIGGALSNAWNALGSLVSGVWQGITGAIKAEINGIITIINGLIQAIDNIHINIPQVGPFGGGSIGFNIPQIPYLASGGDVSGLFVGGEDGAELLTKPGLYKAPRGSHVYSAGDTANILSAAARGHSVGSSGGGYQGPQVLQIHIAGRRVADAILPDMVQAIRNTTGIRHM